MILKLINCSLTFVTFKLDFSSTYIALRLIICGSVTLSLNTYYLLLSLLPNFYDIKIEVHTENMIKKNVLLKTHGPIFVAMWLSFVSNGSSL